MSANRTGLITSDPSLSNVQHCALRNCCLKSLAILIFLGIITIFAELNQYCYAGPLDDDTHGLTLEECLTSARDRNPIILSAQEKITELIADYDAARSKFFPTIGVSSYANKLAPNRLSLSAIGSNPQKLYTKESWNSLTGKQILFDGFKTYFSTKAADVGKAAQMKGTEQVLHDVEFMVTEAFYRVLEAEENKKVAQNALEQRRDFERLTNAFYNAGKVTKLDFFRAQSQVFEAEQAVVEAENAKQLAGMILAKTMGVNNPTPITISGDVPEKFPSVSDFNTLWRQAQETNPEIKRLDLDVEQSKILIKAAKADYFPEISLQGNIGSRHWDRGGTEDEYMGGVFMEFPFFEGGLTRARVTKAASQNLQLVELKRDRIDQLRVDLMDARNSLENAQHGVDTARQMIRADTEGYNSSFMLYKNGKAIGLDVLQAQVELTKSQFYFISNAVAYEINYARIKQITGADLNVSASAK
jgi:Outer membrane protein